MRCEASGCAAHLALPFPFPFPLPSFLSAPRGQRRTARPNEDTPRGQTVHCAPQRGSTTRTDGALRAPITRICHADRRCATRPTWIHHADARCSARPDQVTNAETRSKTARAGGANTTLLRRPPRRHQKLRLPAKRARLSRTPASATKSYDSYSRTATTRRTTIAVLLVLEPLLRILGSKVPVELPIPYNHLSPTRAHPLPVPIPINS